MLPKALKSCPKSNKSPNLVTLAVLQTYKGIFPLNKDLKAVVVAQLAERSLLMPEVRGSNSVIGKILNEHINC